jgi:alpha-mannosidase
MRIVQAHATPLFTGTATPPLQIVRVTVAGAAPGADAPTAAPVLVRVEGPGVSTRQPFRIENLPPGAEYVAEVPVTIAAPHRPGSRLGVTVIAENAAARAELSAEIAVAEPGWTIWMVCHFHYDPVWWNTQGEFTQTRVPVPGENGDPPDTRSAFELVRLHLDAARDDPDYKFVLAEVDYLKPYFDVHPEDRGELRELVAAGRVEIVGGAYNEPNTNLTSAESTIRNIVYGLGHQRDVLGADPSIAWALDAFGHDPGYPGLMAAAGMTGSAWARGPYHQWGPRGTVGGNDRMQFPAEFEWISPDGQGLLTSYMANHYGAGWAIHQAADAAGARAAALDQFEALAPVAATRNVLLPVGADHVIPARWATAVHRDFAARYVWPRCVTGLPREFFAAVRAEAAERGIWLTPQTRDMNPVYPGKDVSYIDTKQAQRAAETAVCDGERLATLAWLAGGEYPAESLDKAWRQLAFGAHHDAITGTESDQVYLDLLGGWREAFDRGEDARASAAGFLAGLVKTTMLNGGAGTGQDSAGPGRRRVQHPVLAQDGPGDDHPGLAGTGHTVAGPVGRDRGAGAVPGRGDPVARRWQLGQRHGHVPNGGARARLPHLLGERRRRPGAGGLGRCTGHRDHQRGVRRGGGPGPGRRAHPGSRPAYRPRPAARPWQRTGADRGVRRPSPLG